MAEFSATFVAVLGQVLLNFLWQGALIGLLAALALSALRQARPQARYAVACLALLACVLVPLVSLIVSFATASESFSVDAPATLTRTGSGATAPALFDVVSSAPEFDAALPWIVALWAAGTCVMSWRMALGLAWIRRLRRTPQGKAPAAWQARLDVLAMRFGLHRAVALCLVDDLDSPVTAGWWRPVVLFPAALLTRMPTDLIEALLAHELAHIRRHDYLINLLQSAVEAVLFYHPVTWWLSRRIRIEREQIADQLAAGVACTPRCLALALSELSELARNRSAPNLVPAAKGGQLLARIEQLLRPRRRAQAGARVVLALLGLFAAGIASYAYAQIAQREAAMAVALERAAPGRPQRDTYALVREGYETLFWGPNDDMTATGAAQLGVTGDFVWVHRGGQDYIITDPALVARAGQAWSKGEALSREIEALDRELAVLQQAMDASAQRLMTMRAETPEARRAFASERDRGNRASRTRIAQSRRWNALNRELDLASEQAASEMKALTDEALARRLALSGPPRSPSS